MERPIEAATQPALCHVHRLGLTPYLDAWRLQDRLAAQIAASLRPATLLLLEHPHTFTFGRQGRAGNLLWSEAQLAQRGAEVHWVDRGGDVTYHGPGQLVGYPLLPLGRVQDDGRLPRADYVGYIRRLEAVLIRALARFGIVCGQLQGLTGVWVQPDIASRCPRCPPAARKAPSKIAAIGVKVDANGVSRHGFALNVSPAMSYWDGIIACGLSDYPVISLADLLEREPPMGEVVEAVVEAFGLEFGYTMEEVVAKNPVD
ncbi:MAG TPA: lipoyl(octanoyl) transferase LipB [Anaerolineales bacterium]|nr:lipoyl(octanoyl) transferase LipB [Anaerolineales bacterium]